MAKQTKPKTQEQKDAVKAVRGEMLQETHDWGVIRFYDETGRVPAMRKDAKLATIQVGRELFVSVDYQFVLPKDDETFKTYVNLIQKGFSMGVRFSQGRIRRALGM